MQDLGDGAIELGLQRVLVQTGKYRKGDEDKTQNVQLYKDFAAFVDSLAED